MRAKEQSIEHLVKDVLEIGRLAVLDLTEADAGLLPAGGTMHETIAPADTFAILLGLAALIRCTKHLWIKLPPAVGMLLGLPIVGSLIAIACSMCTSWGGFAARSRRQI